MRNVVLMLGVLVLAGCEAQTPTPKDVATGEAEGVPATPEAAEMAPEPTKTEPAATPPA
jgi:hypothetical protein